jgi:cytochrome c oxidase subunit II
VTPTPRRTVKGGASRKARRWGLLALLAAPFVLSGCTLPTFGAHPSVTTTGRSTYHLWQGFTIGAIVIGAFTLILIVFAAVRYRARAHDTSIPRQSQYHLPMEISYTVIPIVIVLILFAFTVVVEDQVTALPTPQATIQVQAFQWGWRFIYPGFTVVGQTTQKPTMEMPEHEQVRIVLTSLDVVHGFYVRDFNFSRYALPGVTNEFTFDAQSTGTFFGQCTQLCGLYHSLMWFDVKVVTPTAFASWEKTETASAGALAAAAGEAVHQQLSPGIPVKPYIGGGTN